MQHLLHNRNEQNLKKKNNLEINQTWLKCQPKYDNKSESKNARVTVKQLQHNKNHNSQMTQCIIKTKTWGTKKKKQVTINYNSVVT